MRSDAAAKALQALGHEHRLAVFRLLVRHLPDGLTAGEIAAATGLTPSALSFHLGPLQAVGLVRSSRRGRQVIHVADSGAMHELMRFLAEDCCEGRPELCGVPPATGRTERSETAMTESARQNVLFLCTGNSARSIIAEAILSREGMGRFNAYSAGSHPRGEVHPYAADLLRNLNHDIGRLRSKSWDEFAGPDAPKMNFVFTVCDDAANEVCPVWPGQPMTAHWGIPDPAAVEGSEAVKRQAFADAYRMMNNRISIFINLPLAALNRLQLKERLDAIGARQPA